MAYTPCFLLLAITLLQYLDRCHDLFDRLPFTHRDSCRDCYLDKGSI